MTKWILIIWFANFRTYLPMPAVVNTFPTKISCEIALKTFKEAVRNGNAEGVCVPRPER